MTSTRGGRVTSRQTGADDAGLHPRSRSIQVEEFEVAIPGGIWVAIGAIADAILDRVMQKNHRFTLTGESLRQKPKASKKEVHPDPS